MYRCESWTIKKDEHQRIDAFKLVLEKTFESPWDSKEIKPVHPKGNQPWVLIGRTDAEVETPILWPPGVKNWLIGKDPECWERLKAGGEGTHAFGGFHSHIPNSSAAGASTKSKTPINTVPSRAGRNSATLWTFPPKRHLIYRSWSAHIHKNCWALNDACTWKK